MTAHSIGGSCMHSRPRTWAAAAGLALAALVIGTAAFAQTVTASLSGRVTDATTQVVPGATVTGKNADTGVEAWRGTTNESGAYVVPSLPVGRYDVTVELQGFKTVAIRAVRLELGQRAHVDATLSPGELQE